MAANIPRESDEDLTRSAVQTMTSWLTENLLLGEDFVGELFSKQVISVSQYEMLQAHKKTEGCSHAVGTLVKLVVTEKVRVDAFMDVLKNKRSRIYDAIKGGETKLMSGEWTVPGQLDVKVLQDHLKDTYKELSRLQPVPGEEFSVDMSDQSKMMTPDFSAKKVDLESPEAREYIGSYQKVHDKNVVYNIIHVSELEGVFDHVVEDIKVKINNLQPNLVTLIGDPGVGKTTASQNMSWRWATGKGSLSDRFKLVYFIPIRNVKQESIVEVLSDLELLPPSLEQEQSQNLSKYAKDILFILDGADEADITEGMMDLITGKVFRGSSLLLTARPEAKCLQSLIVWPRVKVSLSGTDQSTVDKYLKRAVSRSSDQEWTDFQGKYQEKLTDKSLLLVPLYLTLLSAVLKAHITKGLKCSQFKIPETMTQLFNVFMHVIITRWLHRISPNVKPNVSFINSPLGPGSTVPGIIKRSLRCMGQLSFMDLVKPTSSYEFTESQASDFLLDISDIRDSGLFTVGTSGSKTIFFLRHKQLQEYLAAIYLAYTGTKDYFIPRLLCSEENKGKCLSDVIHHVKLIKVIQFTCGLSDTFFTSLLTSAATHFTIMKSRNTGHIDVYYEAALFCEQNPGDSQTGYDQLTQYLTQCTPKQGGEFNFLVTKTGKLSFYQKCLHKLSSIFDVHVSVRLLSNLYNIHLISESSVQGHTYKLHRRGGVSSPGSDDNRLCLDQLQAELLSAVCIPGVHCISAGYDYTTVYVDIPGLLGTFTDIQELDVKGGPYIPYTSTVRSDRVYSTTPLTSVTLYHFHTPTPLPESHVVRLLEQPSLTRLVLYRVSILCTPPHLLRGRLHLEYLELCDDFSKLPSGVRPGVALCGVLEDCSHTLQECVLRVYRVHQDLLPQIGKGLKALTQLKTLKLRVGSVHGSGCTGALLVECVGGLTNLHLLEVYDLCVHQDQIELLCVLLGAMRHLHTLRLGTRITHQSDCTHRVVIHTLQQLSQLRTLMVRYNTIQQSVEEFVEAVCTHGKLSSLWVRGGYELPEHLKVKLEDRVGEVRYKWE